MPQAHQMSSKSHILLRPPRPVIIHITRLSTLHLTHGRSTTPDSTAHIDAARLAAHDVNHEGSDKRSPAEPQEGAGSLGLAAVLLCVGGRVAYAVCEGVCLEKSVSIAPHSGERVTTYGVGTAMRAEIRGQRNRGAEAE
jgi:hypothetical protein